MKIRINGNMICKIVNKTGTSLSLLLLLVVCSCNKNEYYDSSNSSMFMNNSQHTGKYNSLSVKSEPSILWKVKTGGQVISSPVLVDNFVFIGSEDQNLYAIDALSGVIEWTFQTDGPINSTPVVAMGKVMFLSMDGYFYAVSQSDGKLIWKFKTKGETKFNVKDYYNGSFKPDFWDFYLSSAIVNNNIVYFGSSDANIYALNVESGEKVWNYKTGGGVHSSPALYDNSLLVGAWDSRIYCLDVKNGLEKWTYTTGRDTTNYIFLGIQASPSIADGIAYIGSRDSKVYALNVRTGDTLWSMDKFNGSWMPSSAAIGKDNIYIGSSDSSSFFSINKKTGKINYATKTNSYTFSSPAIDTEMAYIGSANGRLFGVDLDKGDIKWVFQTIGNKNDTIEAFNQDGKMDLQRMKKLTEGIDDMPTLSSLYSDIFIGVGAILSSPIIEHQVIYFGSSDGYIYAVSDKK